MTKQYKEELTDYEKQKIKEMINGMSKQELSVVIQTINERLLNSNETGIN